MLKRHWRLDKMPINNIGKEPTTMQRISRTAAVFVMFVLFAGSASGATTLRFEPYRPPHVDTKGWPIHAAANPNPSAAYTWMNVILEASARRVDRVGARPTIISREMMIATTGMFDAWAAY